MEYPNAAGLPDSGTPTTRSASTGCVLANIRPAFTRDSYSLIVMSPRKLIGARDPFGFKPLCIGKRDNAYFLSSETCALDTVGAEFIRDILPGEIVTITRME